MPFQLSPHRHQRLSPLNLPPSLIYFKNYRVILETQIAASCNRRPGFLNKRLPHERCWLRCKPSRGVNAWRLAQTAKPRYGACGAALSAVCPYICPSANYPHTYTCSTCTHQHTHTHTQWNKIMCFVLHMYCTYSNCIHICTHMHKCKPSSKSHKYSHYSAMCFSSSPPLIHCGPQGHLLVIVGFSLELHKDGNRKKYVQGRVELNGKKEERNTVFYIFLLFA